MAWPNNVTNNSKSNGSVDGSDAEVGELAALVEAQQAKLVAMANFRTATMKVPPSPSTMVPLPSTGRKAVFLRVSAIAQPKTCTLRWG